MRYTRYEYKKSSKLKFLLSIIIIAGVSISGGWYVSNIIFDGKQIQDVSKSNSSYSNDENNQENLPGIIALQCGYYSKEENAKEVLSSLSKYCQPFIVEDDGKYRVLAGMYNEADGAKKIEEFKLNNIDVAKINLNIPSDSLESKKLIEIVNGLLTITNKLQDSDVKSIKTAEFKSWADKIINDEKSSNSKKIDDLSEYIKNLPDDIDKTNCNTNIQQLYKLIKN